MEPQQKEQRALEDAAVLLRFAAGNLANLPPDAILAIQFAWKARDEQTWSPEIGQKFWSAFNQICTAISPVTVESILTNENTLKRAAWRARFGADMTISLSARTARRFLTLMLTLLVAAVFFGYVVNTANNFKTEVDSLQAEDKANIAEIRKDSLDLYARIKNDQLALAKFRDDPAAAKEIDDLTSTILALDAREDQAAQDVELASQLTYLGLNSYHLKSVKSKYATLSDVAVSLARYQSNEEGIRKYMQDSWLMVTIINSMILPVLLGAMGACAYIVRLISDQIRNCTFFPTSRIRDVGRVALGALAGVVIGYGFTTPDKLGISAAALAFIAGYALDPVFATVDKIAQSFK